MSEVPWGCVPGWDVPHNFFDPDTPDPDDESFMEMVEERMDRGTIGENADSNAGRTSNAEAQESPAAQRFTE